MPLTTISLGVGTSKVIPAGASTTTECEKPTLSSSAVPRRAARYPTPWISRRFSKPFVTPSTMFAISDRVRPCSARSSPRSVGLVTTSSSSLRSTVIRAGICCVSSPSGPLTITRPGSMAMFTPVGTGMGCLPMRLMERLPDEGDDLAADAALRGRSIGDETVRGGQDRGAHAAKHARQAVLARIDAAAGLGHALEVGDHALAAAAVLQLDDEVVERLAALDVEVLDVALFLEQAGNLDLELGRGHDDAVLQRLVGVADAGEHVGYGIGQHWITSSISSCRGCRPGVRARGGRSGRGRTCGRPRGDVRSGCSGNSHGP